MYTSTQTMPDGSQGVKDRRMLFCQRLHDHALASDQNPLITHCSFCGRFFVLCCKHFDEDSDDDDVCHHFRLVFTDGSCLGNGQAGATAGIGVAIGKVGQDQWSVPIDETVDAFPKRTSQRAELLAALEGLRRISKSDGDPLGHTKKRRHSSSVAVPCWVVATDSEYVVKGITEWFPVWKKNGWHSAQGHQPANLDLFQKLDAMITKKEKKYDVDIGFWHIPREFNTVADKLAKSAALAAAGK